MLARRNPIRDFYSLRRAMDDIFNETLTGLEHPASWDMAMDVSETEDGYTIRASVPGAKADDIEITYNNNTLTVRGETREEETREGEKYHLRERRYGSFSRSIMLPTRVNADQINADYQDGILTIHLPKAEEARPRRIEVRGGGEEKVIEG